MSGPEADKYLQRLSAVLGDHFEAVQIMVSWTDANGTHSCRKGVGNWYARIGMAREFLGTDQAHTAAHEIKQVLPPPDTGGDEWRAGA